MCSRRFFFLFSFGTQFAPENIPQPLWSHGGQLVPLHAIPESYEQSLKSLPEARKHADDVLVYNNTTDGKGHPLVARFIAGELVFSLGSGCALPFRLGAIRRDENHFRGVTRVPSALQQFGVYYASRDLKVHCARLCTNRGCCRRHLQKA